MKRSHVLLGLARGLLALAIWKNAVRVAVAEHRPTKAPAEATAFKLYKSKYGFEIKYPSRLKLTEEGPDPYELQLRAGETISGTQDPLLEQIILRDAAKEIIRIDVDHYPLMYARNQWRLRPCGQDGFMEIESQREMRLAGRRAIHIVSTSKTENGSTERVHFLCMSRPYLVFSFGDDVRERAEAIIATMKFAH